MGKRGRHQSTCKEGERTLEKVGRLPGVSAVIIGRSTGGKAIGRGKPVGFLKLQRAVPGGFKAVLQSSKGVQELFVQVEEGLEGKVEAAVNEMFPIIGSSKR